MLKPDKALDEDQLRAHLQLRLANFKVPTRVAFTSEPLPRNPAGKFLKREMQRRYFATAE
jgi:long-chain acyl-CoA synthetase